MKIKGENYQVLKEAVDKVINEQGNKSKRYQQGMLTFRRYCFDLFYATGIRIGDGIGVRGDIIIENCNDDHIFTALKRIVKDHGVSNWD